MTEPTKLRVSFRLRLRSLVSFLLSGSLIVMVLSGTVLYVAPGTGKGRLIGWSFWGMARPGWAAQHIVSSWVFAVAALMHLAVNVRTLKAYLARKVAGRVRPQRIMELLLALALLAYMVLGTLWKLPPWNTVLSGSQHYSDAVSGGKHGHGHNGRGQEGRGYRGGREFE